MEQSTGKYLEDVITANDYEGKTVTTASCFN